MSLNKNHYLLEEGWNKDDNDFEKKDTDSEKRKISRNQMTKKVLRLVYVIVSFHSNIVFLNRNFCLKKDIREIVVFVLLPWYVT